MGHAGQAWGDTGQIFLALPPTPTRAQPEQVLGRGQRLMHQTQLVAGFRYRLSLRGSGQPPPPSPESWDTAGAEHEGEKKKEAEDSKMRW